MSATMQSQQAETPNNEKPADDSAALGALADLFRGASKNDEGDDQAERPEAGQKGPPKKSKPKNLDQLAETLGVEVKELYSLQVPSSREGAEPFTLGKLKDMAAAQDSFAIRTLKFDEDVRRKELELEDARDEIRLLMSAMPETALKPDALKKVREYIANKRQSESARVLEAIPEWQDQNVQKAERAGMAEHLRSYGLPPHFLDTVHDPRTLRYIRENHLRDERVKQALELVKERNDTPARSRQQSSKRGDAQARTDTAGGLEERRARGFLAQLNK